MQIGLWDAKATQPAVRNVAILPSGEVMCPLEEALPLRALLAPVDTCAEQITAAVEGLQPRQRGLFGFGPAMHAIMDYAVRAALTCAASVLRGPSSALLMICGPAAHLQF